MLQTCTQDVSARHRFQFQPVPELFNIFQLPDGYLKPEKVENVTTQYCRLTLGLELKTCILNRSVDGFLTLNLDMLSEKSSDVYWYFCWMPILDVQLFSTSSQSLMIFQGRSPLWMSLRTLGFPTQHAFFKDNGSPAVIKEWLWWNTWRVSKEYLF